MITYTVINHAGVSSALIARAKAAIVTEVNRQVSPRWHTPLIAFRRSGGWEIDFVPLVYAERVCGAPACHWATRGKPAAMIGRESNPYDQTLLFGHEVIETTTDPSARYTRREVCDPVDGRGHFQGGVYVPAFVNPHGRMINWAFR